MKYLYGKGVTSNRYSNKTVRKQFLTAAGIFVLAVTAASLNFAGNRAAATVPGNNTRASITGAGTQPTGESYQSMISRDGRFITFSNGQNYFVGTDWNNSPDVFVRDLSSSAVTRASVSTAGVSADHGANVPVISETGRYVVFTSTSSNLIDGRTISVSSNSQLYMRDTVSNTTTILTEISPGTFANDTTFPYDVSNDGRYVLFGSPATNLGPTITTTGWHYHVYLLDRATNAITWVDAQAPGAGSGNDTYDAHMSCDGSFIVFDSSASYLGVTPTSSHVDVFLLDRRGGSGLTNITSSANGAALNPRISCNGNYIGFASYANNLDPITAGMAIDYHAYLYDRINGQFSLIDQTSSGALANSALMHLSTDRFDLSLSDDGSAIFASQATNLDAAATSGGKQVFFRNQKAGTTELLTKDSSGVEGDGSPQTRAISISLDGKLGAYESYSTNLVSGDTNSVRDIFVSETGL
jgi:hypothetical protein